MGCNLLLFISLLLFSFPCHSIGSNHWIVTENGKVKAQDGSPFMLQHSHDIMALIMQEERVSKLHTLRHKLVHYKHSFVEYYEMNRHFVSSLLGNQEQPPNCKREEVFFIEPSTIPFEDKGISHHDYLDPAPTHPSREPFCDYFSTLPFSMYSMNHLPAVQDKESLSSAAEILIIVPFYLQLNEFGNSVYQGLERNTTSWVLYSLAAMYWRAQGKASQAIDCIQRSLYYAPSQYHDISLLHLTNVFLSSNRLDEALIPLKTALSFSPSKGPLFYTLGLIYKELGYISDSITALDTALHYKYHHKNTLGLRNKLYCQLISEGQPHGPMDRIIDAKNVLKQFCRILEDTIRDMEGTHSAPFNNLMNLLTDTSSYSRSNTHWIYTNTKDSYTRSNTREYHSNIRESHSKSRESRSSTTKSQSNSKKSHSESQKFHPNTTKDSNNTTTSMEVLLVCVIDDIEGVENGYCNSSSLLLIERELNHLRTRQQNYFSKTNKKPKIELVCKKCRKLTKKTCPHVSALFRPRPICLSKVSTLRSTEKTSRPNKKPSRYTEAYRSMEFLPYSPLPSSLEEVIFHNKVPSMDYHDPYWPNKGHCLEVVEGLGDNLPSFTGAFLTPEVHGIKFKELFSVQPLSWQQFPHCSNVTSLPYSMISMDHLEGVATRAELSNGDNFAESALKLLLITVVNDAITDTVSSSDESTVVSTIEEATRYVTSALYEYKGHLYKGHFHWYQWCPLYTEKEREHSHHWALYNLASVYWRAIGNGLESVECIRRGIHYAPPQYRDVGLIGLANVLHRHGYMDSAMVTARAALDTQPDSPIGHYTIAGVYLTKGDYMASNLHLRLSLHLQPHFGHAYSALKLVRCSLKFKEEKKLLEQKQQLLYAQQELIRSGRERTSENLQEILQEVIKQQQQKEQKENRNLEEDEVVKYLTHLAMMIRKDNSLTLSPSPSPSLSPSLITTSTKKSTRRTRKPKYTMELMAKENEREEELRKKWPENLPWPTLEDCKTNPPPQYVVFTSTWLSVTAKKINITDYMDFAQSIDEYSLLPFCDLNFEPSSITLNYLEGMEKPPLLDYIAERGLEEVLCKLSGSTHTMEEMATRMKLAMMKNDSNWVVSNLAALYWRIVGDGVASLKCLKHALYHAPPHNRDVAYVSLANVLYRSGYYEDAATCMQLALETSPNLVVNHFTMANILAAQSFYREAAGYYELVLYHQPEFGPASERLRASRCMIVLGDNKIRLKDLHNQLDKSNN